MMSRIRNTWLRCTSVLLLPAYLIARTLTCNLLVAAIVLPNRVALV